MSRRGPGGGLKGACRLFQLPASFQHSIVSPFPHEDGRPHVTFHQINCGGCHGVIAFPHTLPVSFSSLLSGGSEEQAIWTASVVAAEFRGGRRANLAPLRSDGSYLEF